MTEHTITPPPELVTSLRNSAPHGIRGAGVTREIWLIKNAYAAGADQQLKLDAEQINQAWQKGADLELEACCDFLQELLAPSEWITGLRAARRFKPPSLKEQAMALIEQHEDGWRPSPKDWDTIIRALEALPE